MAAVREYTPPGRMVSFGTLDPIRIAKMEREELLVAVRHVSGFLMDMARRQVVVIDEHGNAGRALCTVLFRIMTHKVANAALLPQERLALVWNYLHAQIEAMPAGLFIDVQAVQIVQSPHGRCKALVRQALNKGMMGSLLESFHRLLLFGDEFSETLFSPHAFLFNGTLVAEAVELLEMTTLAVSFRFTVADPALDAELASSSAPLPRPLPASPGDTAGQSPPGSPHVEVQAVNGGVGVDKKVRQRTKARVVHPAALSVGAPAALSAGDNTATANEPQPPPAPGSASCPPLAQPGPAAPAHADALDVICDPVTRLPSPTRSSTPTSSRVAEPPPFSTPSPAATRTPTPTTPTVRTSTPAGESDRSSPVSSSPPALAPLVSVNPTPPATSSSRFKSSLRPAALNASAPTDDSLPAKAAPVSGLTVSLLASTPPSMFAATPTSSPLPPASGSASSASRAGRPTNAANSFRLRYIQSLDMDVAVPPVAPSTTPTSLPPQYGSATELLPEEWGDDVASSPSSARQLSSAPTAASLLPDDDCNGDGDVGDEDLGEAWDAPWLSMDDAGPPSDPRGVKDSLLRLHYIAYPRPPVDFDRFVCAACRAETAVLRRVKRDEARFCEYTGRFYCAACHSGQERVLPSGIVQRWDFKPRPVCNVASQYLDDMYTLPCIDLRYLSAKARKAHATPSRLLSLRRQITQQRSFILTCRDSQIQPLMAIAEPYLFTLTAEPYVFSIESLCKAVKGDFEKHLKRMVDHYSKHITSDCELCRGKGSLCEARRAGCCKVSGDSSLFPFQLKTCRVCPSCGAVYHSPCYPTICNKCREPTSTVK